MKSGQIRRRKREKIVFEIIPLIDVMMILAIFFAILAFMPQLQSAIETKLPKASESEKSEEALIVTIGTTGDLLVGNQAVSKKELAEVLRNQLQKNKDQPLLLAADKNLEYQKVVEIIDIMKSTGALQIGLITESN